MRDLGLREDVDFVNILEQRGPPRLVRWCAGPRRRTEAATHERLTADEAGEVVIGSNRACATVFAVVFLLVGLL